MQVGHYRTADGDEVGLVLEDASGDVVAVEVKAGSTYRRQDVRGLQHLRRRLGRRFRAGILLNLGELSGTVDDRITVAPLDVVWS